MDRTQYTNLAKAWEFTEEHARERESDALTDTRTAADESGQLQGSAAQARLLRVHGVIVFTDVLALEDGQGGVINPADRSDKAIAMRELLTTVEDDEGFESTLTPDGTGLLIAYKK